ncbi:MAG: DNA-formamidopyrimidine glycosylase [Microcystaceae cyanobacterium]
MPELPEVETVRRGLNQLTVGQTIEGGEVCLSRSLAYPDSESEFWSQIIGLRFLEWRRRGKYLLATLEDQQNQPQGGIGVHLRMTGQLLWLNKDKEPSKHTRVRFFCENQQELRFVDIRTFGKIWWIPPMVSPEKIITGLQKLGLEPFSEEFTAEFLKKSFQRRKRAIKTVLLDQDIIAGLGNIYADEALFKSGIRPTAIASQLTLPQLERLRSAIIEVLEQSIEHGGTTFSDFQGVTGINGNYGGIAWVYRRTGQPCRICDTTIERIKLGGRSTHFCPKCQFNS